MKNFQLLIKLLLISLIINVHAVEQKPTILVTGGAGYIGSHTAFLMAQKGYNVIILDNNPANFNIMQSWATTVEGDYADEALLHSLFSQYPIMAVMHFAGSIEVGESVKRPLSFYENNVSKTIALLKVMIAHDIKTFIFSSSAAVYGTPQQISLTEDHPRDPINPYGKTKYVVEMMLEDVHHAHGINFVALRYFNAAGALPKHNLGERHNPETHVIPLLLDAAHNKKPFKIFGIDYQTHDGTCVRDYLHVWDIAQAHYLALEYLNNGGTSTFFNLGTGTGTSVQEMLKAVQQTTLSSPSIIFADRRAGDPAVLVADAGAAHTVLGWNADNSSLDNILKSAYEFYVKNRN